MNGRRGAFLRRAAFCAAGVGCISCGPGAVPVPGGDRGRSAEERVLLRELGRIDSAAAAIDRIFQPLPLLTFAEQAALARATNAQHLARARALGIPRGLSDERLAQLERDGRLVRVESSPLWVVRDLGRSQALAVPTVPVVLGEIGERFHARLAALGVPRYRVEISSLLRTAADQAALRRVNPNAAAGESTHEFGTTFDILYSAYSAPADPIVRSSASEAPGVEQFLDRFTTVSAERVAGRRALELKAILGKVLLELQREGRLLVTMERLQPVYHITIARAAQPESQ